MVVVCTRIFTFNSMDKSWHHPLQSSTDDFDDDTILEENEDDILKEEEEGEEGMVHVGRKQKKISREQVNVRYGLDCFLCPLTFFSNSPRRCFCPGWVPALTASPCVRCRPGRDPAKRRTRA